MNRSDIRKGQSVHIDPSQPSASKFAGVTWTVDKVNPVNILLTHSEDGRTKRLTCSPEFILDGPAPEGSVPGQYVPAGITQVPGSPLTQVPIPVFLDNGTVVEFTNRGTTALYVVTAETRGGYRIFPLGGSTRYYTNIPSEKLTVVSLADLKDRL